MKYILSLLALLIALPAVADIYKCRQADGRVEISNTPCGGGSNTVKALPDEQVSESNRQQAERDIDRMEEYADKLEARRKAEEANERRERDKQQAAAIANPGPSPASVESCLRSLDRMALDQVRRSDLENSCRTTGSVQSIQSPPANYYGGPVYVTPYPPRPVPKPLPAPAPQRPIGPGKPASIYQSPDNYRAR